MENEDIIFLYAKVGYFFASCDGGFSQEEELKVKTKIRNICDSDNFIFSDEMEEKLGLLKNQKYSFEDIVQETNRIIADMSYSEKNELLQRLTNYVESIIRADGQIQKNEKKFFDKWNENFNVKDVTLQKEDKLKEMIFLLYAKTGYYFAKCGGVLNEKEELTIKTHLQNLKSRKGYASIYNHTEGEIQQFKANDIKFDDVKKMTSEVLNLLKKSQIKSFVENMRSFVKEVIDSDSKLSEIEKTKFEEWNNFVSMPIQTEKTEKNGKKRKKPKTFSVITAVLLFLILAVIGISVFFYGKTSKKKKALQEIPLSAYMEKALQFKELDFSKVLIYGTNSEVPEKDSTLIYFVKGTVNLRLTHLDQIEIDVENTTDKDLQIIYRIPQNSPKLPIEADVVFDEKKCRLIESINAKPMSEGMSGKIFKTVTTTVFAGIGALAGNKVGDALFGMKGKMIGTTVGASIGASCAYIFTSNFCKETSLVKENNADMIVDLFDEAKPVIVTQLLYDDYVSSGTEDSVMLEDYYQQQIADLLSEIFLSNEVGWEKVSVRFVTEAEAEAQK